MAARRRTPKTQTRYTETQKIKAVAALLTADPEHTTGEVAMSAARAVLGANVGKSVLFRWVNKYQDKVLALKADLVPTIDERQIVEDTHREVLNRLVSVQNKYLDRLNDDKVVETTSARDAAVVMGIASDKVRDIVEIPSEYQVALRRLMSTFGRLNIDLLALLDRLALQGEQQLMLRAEQDTQLLLSADNPSISSPLIQDEN